MEFLERNLAPGERIVARAKLHLVVFLFPGFIFFLSLLLFSLSDLFYMIAFMLLLGSLFMALVSWLTYQYTEYVLTNKRIIAKTGWLARKTRGIILQKVESVDVIQTAWGRILGYGTVVVTGTGGTRDVFYNIDDPFDYRNKVQQVVIEINN